MSSHRSGEHPAVRAYEVTLQEVAASCDERLTESERKLEAAILAASKAADEAPSGRITIPSVPS